MSSANLALLTGVIFLLLGASIAFSSVVSWIDFAYPMSLAILLELIAALSFFRIAKQSERSWRLIGIVCEALSILIAAQALRRLLAHWGVTL